MAKLEDASEDVVKLFEEVKEKVNIKNWVEFHLFCNNKMKNEVCKIIKSNELIEKYSEGVNFTIYINEEIFDKLPDDMKRMAIDECLAGVDVNENDVVSLVKPDFNTYTGVLRKYTDEKVIRLHESIKSLFDEKKQKDAEDKANKPKGKRGRKSKFIP